MRIKALVLAGLAAIIVAVLALSLGRGSSTRSGAKPSASANSTASRVSILINNYAFEPQTLTVRAGARVTWTNHDATAHTATAKRGSFDTGTINPGRSKTIDLTRPGTYTYYCAFHAFMTATISVAR
jgi:plastocyanin